LEAAEMFGLGSTGLNAGGIRYQFATAVNIELSTLSIGMMERFAGEMDQEVGLRHCGYLFMLDSEVDLAQFRKNVALQNAHGVPSRIVSAAEIAALAPEVNVDGIIGGSWCPRDGLVDPNGLLQGYVTHARRLGATCATSTPATAIDVAVADYVASSRTPAPSRRRPSSSPRAHGPRRSARWRASSFRSRRSPADRRDGSRFGTAADFPCHRLLARCISTKGAGILTGMSNRDELPAFDTTVDEEWRCWHLERSRATSMLADAEISPGAGLYEVPDDQPILGGCRRWKGSWCAPGSAGTG
jgi:sarcosine oxidase subunit beta